MSEIPTKTVPIDSLTPHPENYNQHPESQIAELAESDQSFGQYRNVVVWSPDSEIDLGNGQKLYPDISYILAGNGYWLGRRRAGRDTIEVKDYTGIPYEDALMLMQIDNAAPLGAQPDPDRLKILLEKTRERAIDRPKLGAMLARLRESAGVNGNGAEPPKDPGPQVNKAEQLAEKWGTQTGQVWTLGAHRLAVGDCTDKAVVEAAMRGERAEIEIHDPPYGISLDTDWSAAKSRLDFAAENPFFGGKKHKPIEGDFVDYDPLFLFERDSIPKEMFLWGADYYIEKIPNRNNGSWLIWDKRLDEAGDRMYGSAFETCWSLSRHKRDFIRVKWAGIFGTEQEPDRKRLHPTQKPVLLYEWILSRYSKEGDISGDFYLGAGSHLIACEQLKRKCRAIEIDPGYCAVALQRWADLTDQDPVLLSE